MRIEELLPIGSVVLLSGGEKRLMIIGIMQTELGGSNESYDYLGVWYPEGHFGDVKYLFNHEDIAEVYFRGFEDEERSAFIEQIRSLYGK